MSSPADGLRFGDYVFFTASAIRQSSGGDATLLRTEWSDDDLWVRSDDILALPDSDGAALVRGRMVRDDEGATVVALVSLSETYNLTIPHASITSVEAAPWEEPTPTPGHVYMSHGDRWGYGHPYWLLDGHGRYYLLLEEYPNNSVDRESLPDRLVDLGHISDLI